MKRYEHIFREGIELKFCPKCNEGKGDWKPLLEFRKDSDKVDKLYYCCKACCQKRSKEYLKNEGAEVARKWSKKHYQENTESCKKQSRTFYNDNRIWVLARELLYSKKRYHSKLKLNPFFRLNSSIRTAVGRCLKGKKLGNRWKDIVGWTLDDLITHMESLFLEGMAWENYGIGHGKWVVHHCNIPISAFTFTSLSDPKIRECWALENLAPLWWYENLMLSDRFYQKKKGL